MVSRVLRATPPKEPPLGEGRMKARGSLDSRSIRVLSPKMLPPDTELDGSIANTATRDPVAVSWLPRASKKVLFPTPGTPVTPTSARRAGRRQEAPQQLLSLLLVIRPLALDQGDGATEDRPIPLDDAVCQLCGREPSGRASRPSLTLPAHSGAAPAPPAALEPPR